MQKLFKNYVPWKILRHFATYPDSEFYVNQLARELGLSYGMCSISLRALQREGWFTKRELGRAHYYRINDNFMTRELKQFVSLHSIYESKLVDEIQKQVPGAISIVLYGSFADGTYSGKSDIDILIIAPGKPKVDLDRIERKLNHEINFQIISLGQWLGMKDDNKGFYETVSRNHVVLSGGELT